MKLFQSIVCYMAVLTAMWWGYKEHAKALDAQGAYESAMGQLEAFNRTRGHISPAYICRSK